MMNCLILVSGVLLISLQYSYCDICLDILNFPDREYSLEDVNRCHECGWYLIHGDVRTAPYISPVPATGPELSRLEYGNSAWCSANDNDYLEIGYPHPTKIGGFKITGYDEKWIEALMVYYEDDIARTHFAKSLDDGSEMFLANENDYSSVTQKFAMPIVAQRIRIMPVLKHNAACLRIDLFSCENTTIRSAAPTGVASDDIPACTLNPRTDCGETKCAKYKTNDLGCQICECDMTTGGVWEMDILLDEPTINIAQVRLSNSEHPDGTYSAGARHAKRFQDYKSGRKYLVYYVMSASFSAAEQRQFKAAIAHIAAKSCIQLTPLPSGRSYPYYLRFIRGGGCYSPVGKVSGGNQVSIGYGCGSMGIIVHEIMHSLGFWHEQSRPDRDNYVTINWSNIRSGVQYNFQKQASSSINSFNSPYDYNSLMHYGSTAFSSNGGQTIIPKRGRTQLGQRSGLSVEDAKQLNAMYGCNKLTGRTTTTTVGPATTTKSGGSCIDENKSCGPWAKSGECSKNPKYMLVKCKKSCNACKGGGRKTTTRRPNTTTKPRGSCRDGSTSCGPWARRGECQRNPRYMLIHCKRSCRVCRSENDCRDGHSYCPRWKQFCNSRSYPYVRENCKKTCGTC